MNVRYDMIAVYVVRSNASGRSHEFLQLKRAAGDYMGGTWQIVRGKSHPSEKAWQAALRELFEETGLTPREFYRLSLMETFYLTVDETVWHVPSFVAIVSRDDVVRLNEEHEGWRWVPRDEILSVTMWAGEKLLAGEVMNEILDNGLSKSHLRVPLEEPR